MPTYPLPSESVLRILQSGVAIPAHPLALNAQRKLDERRQRALTRYYLAAGSGGLAVAVHSTQFEIREPKHGLLKPVLTLAMEEMRHHEKSTGKTVVKVAGICGPTQQAVAEAKQAVALGYDMGLLSLAALAKAGDDELMAHSKAVAQVIPVVGFYLQPSVGGRILPATFWRRFAEIPNVVAIKMAPFNRYQTLDVVRAVAEAGRAIEVQPAHHAHGSAPASTHPPLSSGIALYTGNDDNIVCDLLGNWTFTIAGGKQVTQRIVGGLLGHWACWTQKAVELLKHCQEVNQGGSGGFRGASGGASGGSGTSGASGGGQALFELMDLNRQVTDMNAAMFDPAHRFHGCIPGMHEILRRQGLLAGTWCLNPDEAMSPGQAEELTRVSKAYPHLVDDDFIKANLDQWLR